MSRPGKWWRFATRRDPADDIYVMAFAFVRTEGFVFPFPTGHECGFSPRDHKPPADGEQRPRWPAARRK
jgi:hypothetical protein